MTSSVERTDLDFKISVALDRINSLLDFGDLDLVFMFSLKTLLYFVHFIRDRKHVYLFVLVFFLIVISF